MKINITFKGDYAASEIVGGLILVLMAVAAFSIISLYIYAPLGPEYETSVRIDGSVNNAGEVLLEHVGGESIETYKIIIYDSNGTLLGSKIENNWKFGEYRYPLENITDIRLENDTVTLSIMVCSIHKDGTDEQIFTWGASGKAEELRTDCPVLISSLKANTPDEDLICYSYPVQPEINATTYIYNWRLNGVTLLDLNMPFNTENNATCKDYSGYGNDGTLNGVTWYPIGILGGCYHFGGSSEYITMSLPNVFYDIPNNDFTISLWLKSSDITADNAVVLMASEDNSNFIKIFLQGNEIHAGVCYDGTKDAVRTEALQNETWYHIGIVWNADEKLITIYCNGEPYTLEGERTFALGSGVDLLEIGHGTASSKFWDGYMDELEVYNRALTEEQIYQIYFSTKDGDYSRRLIVAEQTNVGEYWQAIVTPNDGVVDDASVASNILKIVNYAGGD